MSKIRKILISPGFGAGWSTWIGSMREEKEFALFDSALIAAVESGENVEAAIEDFAARFGDEFGDSPYLGGARNLVVETVTGQFQVEEYDGSESLRFRDSEDWF